MLIRYRRSEDGRPVAKALVYTHDEHKIDRSRVDPDALRIIERLRENGHEAYIVGGAVRDLLLGRRPKDFDIVTEAQPPRIKRVFRNARVIGRRFRLVHVYAGAQIFEVSTFRSIAKGTVGNEFGTMDEDALRRDFTCNALYYDPVADQLVDYVGGFKDIAARRIVPVIPLKSIFAEDPVRMIRCVKYASTSSLRIPFLTRRAIRRDAGLLAEASSSRLTEEFQKILGSGKSQAIIKGLADFDLLRHILPEAAALLARDAAYRSSLYAELAELDLYVSDPKVEKRLSVLIAHYLKPFLESRPGMLEDSPEAYQEAVREVRLFLSPLNPPRVELEAAVLIVFKKRGISPLQRPRRAGPERGRGGPDRSREERGRGGPRRAGGAKDEVEPRAEKAEAAARHPRDIEKKDRVAEDLGGEAPAPARKRRRRRPASGRTEAGAAAQAAASPSLPTRAAPPAGEGSVGAGPASTSSGAAKRRRRRKRKPSGGSEGGVEPQE